MVHCYRFVFTTVVLFGLPSCCGAHAWRKLFQINPGGSSIAYQNDVHSWNATKIPKYPGHLPPPPPPPPPSSQSVSSRRQMKHRDGTNCDDFFGSTFESNDDKRKITNLILRLGGLCFPPPRPFPRDILVELLARKDNGGLNHCRITVYGGAVMVCGITSLLVMGLRLYDIVLWSEILVEVVRTNRKGGWLICLIFSVTGYFLYGSILSIRYACSYYTHETQWYRKLRLGKYNRIWKDASFWNGVYQDTVSRS